MALFGSNQYGQRPGAVPLKMAEYAARHRELWRRAVQFSLFFLDILIITALAVNYVEYTVGLPAHQALERSLSAQYIDFRAYHAQHRTMPLEVVVSTAVPTAPGRGDVVAQLRNPNREWAARVVPYQFVTGGGRTVPQTTFVLPGETRIIAAFNQAVRQDEVARVELGEVAWRRVNPAKLPRVELRAEEFRYTPFATGATGLDFVVVNTTPYSFWTVPVTVAAFGANGIVAVNAVVIAQWRSGEKRTLAVTWPDPLPPVRETSVNFVIDVLDPAVFMPFEGTAVPYPGF